MPLLVRDGVGSSWSHVEVISRFVLLGAGAIGGTVGGLLAASGREVSLVARGAHGAALAADGLRLRTCAGDHLLRLPVAERPVDLRSGDVAIVATKLQDAGRAYDDLLAAAGPDLPVLCAHNGLEGERLAAARFRRVVGSVSWMPCAHLTPGEVLAFGEPTPGVFDLAAHTPAAVDLVATLAEALRAAGFVVNEPALLAPRKWTKLLLNLGNVCQVLHQDPAAARAEADAAVAEGEALLRAAGVAWEPIPEFVAPRLAACREGTIAGATRGGGSTWQSHARGRPLETHFLNGEVVRLAESLGRDAPVNRRLVLAVGGPALPERS